MDKLEEVRPLRETRLRLGITQKEIANELGVCLRTIIDLEKGKGSLKVLEKYKRLMNIKKDYVNLDENIDKFSEYGMAIAKLNEILNQLGYELVIQKKTN